MHCHFKIADGMAAGQVAYRVPSEKQNSAGLARYLTQVAQSALLIC